jgi:hypothetical protein
MRLLGLIFVLGCEAKDDEGIVEDSQVEPQAEPESEPEPEPHSLQPGNYLVTSIETLPNDCNADWSYMEDRVLEIELVDGGLSIADVIVELSGNEIGGTAEEQMDWGALGQDCVTDIFDSFGGQLTSDTSLIWEWESTWEYVSGDTCDEALSHPLPCTYTGVFDLQRVED